MKEQIFARTECVIVSMLLRRLSCDSLHHLATNERENSEVPKPFRNSTLNCSH